jgi:hypothetical protein
VFGSAACLSTHWPAAAGALAAWLARGRGRGWIPDPGSHRVYFDRGTGVCGEGGKGSVAKLATGGRCSTGGSWVARPRR